MIGEHRQGGEGLAERMLGNGTSSAAPVGPLSCELLAPCGSVNPSALRWILETAQAVWLPHDVTFLCSTGTSMLL